MIVSFTGLMRRESKDIFLDLEPCMKSRRMETGVINARDVYIQTVGLWQNDTISRIKNPGFYMRLRQLTR